MDTRDTPPDQHVTPAHTPKTTSSSAHQLRKPGAPREQKRMVPHTPTEHGHSTGGANTTGNVALAPAEHDDPTAGANTTRTVAFAPAEHEGVRVGR